MTRRTYVLDTNIISSKTFGDARFAGSPATTDDGDFQAIKRFHEKPDITGGGEFFA